MIFTYRERGQLTLYVAKKTVKIRYFANHSAVATHE